LNRRAIRAGSEEQDGHMEDGEDECRERGERRGDDGAKTDGDGGGLGGDERAPAGLELLPPGLRAVLQRRDRDPRRDKGTAHGLPASPLRLDEHRRERRKQPVAGRCQRRAVRPEPYQVERPLPEAAAPPVERREVERRERSRRLSQAPAATNVAPNPRGYDRDPVDLPRQQIRREDPDPRPAENAGRERDLLRPLLAVGGPRDVEDRPRLTRLAVSRKPIRPQRRHSSTARSAVIRLPSCARSTKNAA
jgi:hypothetical protein